jgi:hypothetical protein
VNLPQPHAIVGSSSLGRDLLDYEMRDRVDL